MMYVFELNFSWFSLTQRYSFNRVKSNAGSFLKTPTVKLRWREFFPAANIRPFSTAANPLKVTDALVCVGNCYVTMDTFAESLALNPVAPAIFK
jgi:hypothetical protein